MSTKRSSCPLSAEGQLATRWLRGCALVVISTTLFASASWGQVVFKEVDGRGCDADDSSAVVEALQVALSSVGGMRLSVNIGLTVSESVRGGNTIIESNFQQDVERQTRGIVKSYRVLGKEVNPQSGQVCVSLRASVPTYRQSEQLRRLKLAVTPVTVHAALRGDSQAVKFADDVSAAIESQLTSSRRFAVLDRRYGQQTSKELNLILGGATPIEETVKLGMTAGADYVVVAALREFSAQQAQGQSPLGKPIVRWSVPIAIDVRVLDIATRQIKFAHSYVHGGRLPAGIKLSQHAADIGQEVAEMIATAIFPIAVVNVSNGTVTLNQGGDTVQVGRAYRLVQLGKRLTDPYTGESLGEEEIEIGRIEVTSVTDRISTARVTAGKVDGARGAMLVRPLPEGFGQAQAPARHIEGSASQPAKSNRPKSDDW